MIMTIVSLEQRPGWDENVWNHQPAPSAWDTSGGWLRSRLDLHRDDPFFSAPHGDFSRRSWNNSDYQWTMDIIWINYRL
jgi:hypothetical protein